jgi:hypothetical protein
VRKTHRILLITLFIIVLAFNAWLILSQPGEPVYQGKSLSDWCEQYAANSFHSSDQELQRQAKAAIQTIGTNAIPTLLRMLKAKDSKFKLKLIQLSQKQHVINIKWKTVAMRHFEAECGLSSLGTQAIPAVPALVEIYNQLPPDVYTTYHSDIAELLASMGPAAAAAVPRFVQDTTDTNSAIRWRALWVLSHVTARPDLAVPALTRSLRDPVEGNREIAAYDLGAFGTNAQSAVPELIIALNDSSLDVKRQAASALQKIDPSAATNAIANSFKPEKF